MSAPDSGREDPAETAAAEDARRRAVAQQAARELGQMGIDPSALGLESPCGVPRGSTAPRDVQPSNPPPSPAQRPATPRRPSAARPPARDSQQSPDPVEVEPPRPREPGSRDRFGPALSDLAPRGPVLTVPSEWSDLVRAATLGAVTPGAAEAAERERRSLGQRLAGQTAPTIVDATREAAPGRSDRVQSPRPLATPLGFDVIDPAGWQSSTMDA